MAVYIFTILFSSTAGWYLCEYKNTKNTKLLFLTLSGFLLFLFSTIRYGIGFDFNAYKTIFQTAAQTNWQAVGTQNLCETGFFILNKIVAQIGGTYFLLLALTNSIMTILVLYFIYCFSSRPQTSIFVYITFQLWAHSMNLMRQSLAASILLAGYLFLMKKKFLPYAAIVCLAAFFHKSALIMLPFYFLLQWSFTTKFKGLFFIGICTAFVYLFFDYAVQNILFKLFPNYSKYSGSIYWQSNSFLYVVFPFFYFSMVLLLKNKLLEKNQQQNIILINSALYAFLISIFITKHFILERFSIYFFMFALLLIPELITLFKPEPKKQQFVKTAVIVLGLCYFSFSALEKFHNVYPYMSILDRAGITSQNNLSPLD